MSSLISISLTLPISTLSLLVLITLLLYLSISRLRRKYAINNLQRQHACAPPPSYPHLNSLGSDLAHLRASAVRSGTLFKLYKTHFDTYGCTWTEVWRGQKCFNTIDVENVKYVVTRDGTTFGKDPDREIAQRPLMGPSIFSDGHVGRLGRESARPLFARREVGDLEFFGECVERFLGLLPARGKTFDAQPLLHRLFLDTSTSFIFGRSLNALGRAPPGSTASPERTTSPASTPSPESRAFTEAFTTGLKGVSARRDAPWIRFQLQKFFPDPEFSQATKIVHAFVDEQVRLALHSTQNHHHETEASSAAPTADKAASGNASPRTPFILLHALARRIRDPIALRYHILGFFAPARDVTSRCVANALFQLARHPHEWTKLRKAALELGDTALTFEVLRSERVAPFRHVLFETIRTVGPAARIWRVALRDVVLPRGGGEDGAAPVFVPRGAPVVLGTWCMNHCTEIWGDDVECFRPERFSAATSGSKATTEETTSSDSRGEARTPDAGLPRVGKEFLPFYAGPRTCPAQQQAMVQATYVLVRLAQTYEKIENRDPEWEFLQGMRMGVESMNGAKIAFG